MLLQQILILLDDELDRLRNLRKIVASLAKPTIARSPLVSAPDQSPQTKTEGVEDSPRPIRSRSRTGTAKTVARTDAGQIFSPPAVVVQAVRQGPVVVSAAELARERDAKAAVEQRKAGLQMKVSAPDSLARELAARWLRSPKAIQAG